MKKVRPIITKDDSLQDKLIKAGSGTAFYVCSRVKQAPRWLDFRSRGARIVSSWIDEAGVGETACFSDLWLRIEMEVKTADALVLLLEPDDFPLKGALVEAGMALAFGKPVYIYAPDVVLEGITFRPVGSWIKHPKVKFIDDLEVLLDIKKKS